MALPAEETTSPEALRAQIGRCVRTVMAARGVTAREVARALQMAESRFSERLSGRVPFKAEELAETAAILGVSAGVFFEDPAELVQNRKMLHLAEIPAGQMELALESHRALCPV